MIAVGRSALVPSILVALAIGCSESGSTSSSTAPPIATIAPSTAPVASDLPAPCDLLTAADFVAADVRRIEGPGLDVSAEIALATTTSAACEWTGQGTWDLLVGRGGAAKAYEFDRKFAEIDVTRDVDLGDKAFIVDRVESALPQDYDHEAGVLIGDLYVKLSTTSDEGDEATEQLIGVVAERLTSSG